ncbi:MAG: hypothetical protein VKL97_05755 [Cyanobacteriota bacterium]|nr:hypothetical protein [Cyanobacteriota bacterium]
MVCRALLVCSSLLISAAPVAAAPAMVPFDPNSAAVRSQLQAVQSDSVDQFDPVARAKQLAADLPRRWRGSYLAYGSGSPLVVQLELNSLEAVGQMVVLTGSMTVGSVVTPVQGNLNAKSDQLDLLLLGDASSVGLEVGGGFQGLQAFELSSWESPRLTSAGGKLELTPSAGRS